MLSKMVVGLYRIWHGHLRLPGPPPALCEQVAPWTTDLPAAYLGLGTLRVDLRDYAVPAGYQLRSVRGGWDTD